MRIEDTKRLWSERQAFHRVEPFDAPTVSLAAVRTAQTQGNDGRRITSWYSGSYNGVVKQRNGRNLPISGRLYHAVIWFIHAVMLLGRQQSDEICDLAIEHWK
jgi:hypothetical protein